MASSKIKGITIEINGDTSKLQKSLNAINAPINKINKELNDLNKALKLDPKNTELLAQKQEVLSRNIAASKDKLVQLKDAQKQMGDYSKLTDEQKAAYNRLSLEISKSENALKGMNDELKNMNKIDLSKVQSALKKTGEIAAKVGAAVGGAVIAATAAIGNIVKKGVESYAQLEKAQKGSERLFGDSFAIVKRNATDAYRTMGLSAANYYDQVNTYVVGLKNSLKGDTKRAAELANSVLVAQADIVAATGASQEQVSSAFSAIMRGNFSLIDNLRLGIKGSRQGMQEVIQKVNEWNRTQGHATHYQMDNYADMQQALVDYVKMVGVAGTAQQQMSSTITGSLSQMKAAWDNFLNGSGGAKDVSKTMTTFLKNILGALKKLAPDLAKGLVQLLKDIMPQVMSMLNELLPIIVDAAKTIIEGLIKFINDDSSQFITMAVDILTNLVQFIIKNLPLILQAAIKIIAELAIGIGKAAPTLIPAIVDCIMTINETLISNIDVIINAGIQLIIGLIKGIFIAVPQLVQRIPEIIGKIKDGLKAGIIKITEVGKDLIIGLWDGIKSMGAWLWEKVKGFGKDIIGWFEDIFGIASPSKVMMQEGKYLGLGLIEGINDTIPEVERAMSGLATGVETSVNPTINPTANTNPLYITIDKFYNNRETDIQQLAEELEFYRRNSALAKGGV